MASSTSSNKNNPSKSSSSTNRIRILGVCGGIGCGKSSACRNLVERLGCLGHIDSDRLAHTVYDGSSSFSALDEIVAEFGRSILALPNSDDFDSAATATTTTATIDRQKLGSIVFADPYALQRLERIVWPHVRRKVQEEIARLSESSNGAGGIIVVEAAVLLDAGWQDDVDGVWVVSVPREVALERLQATRGLSAAEATKRIDAQQSRRGIGNLEEELANGVVSCVIDNSGTEEELIASLQQKLDDPNAWYS